MQASRTQHTRIGRMLAIACGLALTTTLVFIWVTQPASRALPSLRQQGNQPDVSKSATMNPAGSVILPDRGEPRTQRHARIEEAVEALRNSLNNQMVTRSDLARGLLAMAENAIELDRLAQAQSALGEVLQLMPDVESWQHQQALRLGQSISFLESGDGRLRQRLKDVIDQRVEALRLHAAGRYLDAARVAKNTVAVWRRYDSSQWPTDLEGYHAGELGRDLILLGRLALEHSDTYTEAESVLQEATEISLRVLGAKHPISAQGLLALARIQEDRASFDRANKLYEQSLGIYREAFGELSFEFAQALAEQGRMHLDWWEEFAVGKGYRALQIREQLVGKDHLECAGSLEHLGMNAVWLLNFEKAGELLERALAIRKREQGPEHPELAESLSWLSQVYLFQGDVAHAAVALGKAIELTKTARGTSHPVLIRYLSNLARIGKYDWNATRGDREGRRALEIAALRKMETHPIALDARSAVADLMLEEESPYGISQMIRLNSSYVADFARESIRLHQASPRHRQLPTLAASLIQVANVGYWDNYQTVSRSVASEYLDRANENIQRHGQDLHPAFAEYLLVRGRWHMWNSEHDIAGKLLEQSRDVIEQQYGTLFTEVRAGAYRALSGVSMHMGKKTALATQRLSKTAELDEQIFRRNATGQCDIDRFSMARARFFSLGCCVLNELSGLSAEECYRYLLVSKGETSQLQLIERIFHEKPEFRAAITQVHAARQQLKTVAFDMPSDPKESAAWRDKLFDAADRKETLERELAIALRGRFPDLSAVTPQDIQKHLPPKTAFLDFIHFTDLTAPPEGRGKLHRTRKLCVFVVRPDQPLQYFRLGPANIIEDAITEWRKALQDSAVQSASTIQKCAERVSQLIMAPLRSSIDGCEQILIAPDGPVCFLPFAALPGKAPGTYLIEDVTIGYATSARQSVELYARPKQDYQNRMLAVGNIQYEVQPRGVAKIAHAGRRGLLPEDAQWSDLPASRVEVEQIGELFTKVNGSANGLEILSGRPVELSELQSALQQRYRYFHFAGHGLFAEWDSVRLDQTPSFDETTFAYSTNSESIVLGRAPLLLSGLVLSRPVQSQHPAEAIMTADEVSNLDLRSTELVVLSACETGLGKTAAGEGVMGLQRAFLNAGARSVMASLWKVNDAATSLLMERFYLHLWSGNLSKWEALRQAQLDLLRHPEKLTDREILLTSRGIITGRTKPVPSNITSDQPSKHGAHPVLWSAFVLYGDGRL